MREKLLWSLIALLGLMLAFAHAQSPARPESQIGRFQIITVAGNSNEEAQAFKIDTVTGKTWGKAYAIEAGGRNQIWAVIPDSLGSLQIK
jgi:hypothetical protein